MKPLLRPHQTVPVRVISSALAALLVLAGCGGGGGSPGVNRTPGAETPATTTPTTPTTPGSASQASPEDLNPNLLAASTTYANMCVSPRSGVDASGRAFPDRRGTLLDEQKFLRAWINESYLWFDEVPNTYRMADFKDAVSYFDVLKTPVITASGKAKDEYHFTYPTAEWEALQNEGVELGYGITWSRNATTAPRTWQVTTVEPGSPAAAAGVVRGDLLSKVDGVDFVNANDAASISTINDGLFPAKAGVAHRFTLQRNGVPYEVSMSGADVSVAPVKNVKLLDTPTGTVGYLTFDSHNAVSEKQLSLAFDRFQQAGVSDLVLDVRYNGGGLLYIASQVAYMIAGPANTSGKVFERLQYNSKTQPGEPLGFRSTAYGFPTSDAATPGQVLPTLNLKRVFVISTAGTCSASESIINGLRGVGVDVVQIGGATCGKPYGFTPKANCGTTYFSVEFKGVNHQGFGDYADGLAPTCQVSDDLSREVGDPSERMLATALAYRQNNNTCPSSTSTTRSLPMQYISGGEMKLVRPAIKEISVRMPGRVLTR